MRLKALPLLLLIALACKSVYAVEPDTTSNIKDSLFALIQNADDHQKAKLYNELSVYYFEIDSLAASFKMQLLSQDHIQDIVDNYLKESNYKIAGDIYRIWGDYPEALESYFKAIDINLQTSLKDTNALLKTYSSIIATYSFSRNYEDAVKWGEEAVKIALIYKDPFHLGQSFSSLGGAYGMSKDYDNALINYLEAKTYLESIEPTGALTALYNKLGIAYVERSEFDTAKYFYDKAYSIISEIELSDRYETGILLGFAYYYTVLGEYQNALGYLLKCETRVRETKNLYYQQQVYGRLSNLYKTLGDYESALSYSTLHINANKNHLSVIKERELSKVKLFQWIENRKRDIEALEQKAKTIKIIFLFSLLLLAAILLIIYFRYKNTKLKLSIKEDEKQQIESLYDKKKRELVTLAMNVDHKKSLIEQLDSFIKSIQKETKNAKILKLIQEQRHVLLSNGFYDQIEYSFTKHFEDVHPEFFSHLRSKHPKLTQNDLIHCAYIKLRLKPQEISIIQNITEKSVQMIRYRIKKKTELEKDDDLINYIQSM